MTGTAVRCQHVTKRYGEKRALDDLTLSIPTGRVTGILGPNGSGKSTLFRAITGLTWPDSGELSVLGRRPGWRTNRDIAYLPDRARWYAGHSVSEAFEWAGRLLPEFDQVEAERLAESMGLEMDARAGGMSRGQEARLMLIICIARRVPLIVLDEPFSGIDVPSRERIVEGLIDHMGDSGQTVLVSTHELYEAEGLFDYAIFLSEGRVAVADDAEKLREEHGSMRTILKSVHE